MDTLYNVMLPTPKVPTLYGTVDRSTYYVDLKSTADRTVYSVQCTCHGKPMLPRLAYDQTHQHLYKGVITHLAGDAHCAHASGIRHGRQTSCMACKECSGTGRRMNARKQINTFLHTSLVKLPMQSLLAHAKSTGSCTR
jgi:hypothetical protein